MPKNLGNPLNARPRGSIWCGLGLIFLFAASYLQLGLVTGNQVPAAMRVNNGNSPTFFAFCIEPYGLVSEDFHLYWMRAKRILDRGWQDSLLNRDTASGANFSAPLQVLLGLIAITTDGRPIPYSIFMSSVFLVGWGCVFIVARKALPQRYSTTTIVLAIMVAVLFESLRYFFITPEQSRGMHPWPLQRNMRLSTLAWTTPLLLSLILASMSLWSSRGKPWRWLAWVAAILGILCCADNWALGFAFFAAGLVWLGLTVQWAIARGIHRAGGATSGRFLATFGLVLTVVFALNLLLTDSLSGDAFMRSGFGPAWKHVRKDGGVLHDFIADWIWPWGGLALGLIAGVSRWRFTATPQLSPWKWRLTIRSRANPEWRPLAMALLAVAAVFGVILALSRGGMDPYHRKQFYWRLDVVLLFSLVLVLLDWLHCGLRQLGEKIPRLACVSGLVTAALLASLLAYHEYRIHWFRANVVAKEYFLTKSAEALRPWLEQYDREHQQFTLATVSPELNYLSAYWTNADLLLPSGFPYHTLEDNASIHARALRLLRLYRVSPEKWTAFATPRRIQFQNYWRTSRAVAAGQGFLYHLYHRTFRLDSAEDRQWRRQEIGRFADNLAAPSETKSPKPDVILVDVVSRSLGRPDFADYRLAFKHGDLEAWVRRVF
ncbi:MAG: hypothetical protein IT427_00615 [Pirellulales bacterium]|nr:hypothetical protein [Pirellulales bacterium]